MVWKQNHKTPQSPYGPAAGRIEEPIATQIADRKILIKSKERSEAHTIPVHDATMPVFTKETRDSMNKPGVLQQILEGISPEATTNHKQVFSDGLIYSHNTDNQLSTIGSRVKGFQNYRDAETGKPYFDDISITLEHHEYNATLGAALFEAFINTTPQSTSHLYISTTNEKKKVPESVAGLHAYAAARGAEYTNKGFYYHEGTLHANAIKGAIYMVRVTCTLYGKTLIAYIINIDNLNCESNTIKRHIIKKEQTSGNVCEFFDFPFSDRAILDSHRMTAKMNKIRFSMSTEKSDNQEEHHDINVSAHDENSEEEEVRSTISKDLKRVGGIIHKLEELQEPARTKIMVLNYPATGAIPKIQGYSHYTSQDFYNKSMRHAEKTGREPRTAFKTSDCRTVLYLPHKAIVTLGPDMRAPKRQKVKEVVTTPEETSSPTEIRTSKNTKVHNQWFEKTLTHKAIAVHCPKCDFLLLDTQGRVRNFCPQCKVKDELVINPTIRGESDANGVCFFTEKSIQNTPNSLFQLILPAFNVPKAKPANHLSREPLPPCRSGVPANPEKCFKTELCWDAIRSSHFRFLRGEGCKSTAHGCNCIHPTAKWVKTQKRFSAEQLKNSNELKKKAQNDTQRQASEHKLYKHLRGRFSGDKKSESSKKPTTMAILDMQKLSIELAVSKMIEDQMSGREKLAMCYKVAVKLRPTSQTSKTYIPTVNLCPLTLSEMRTHMLPDRELKFMQLTCSQTIHRIINGKKHRGPPKSLCRLDVKVFRLLPAVNQMTVQYEIQRTESKDSVKATLRVLDAKQAALTSPVEFKSYADRAFDDMNLTSRTFSPVTDRTGAHAFIHSRIFRASRDEIAPIREQLTQRGYVVQVIDRNERTASSMLLGCGMGNRQRLILSYIMLHSHEPRFRAMIPRTQEIANFLSKKADVLLVEDGDHSRPEILSDCTFDLQTPKMSYHAGDDYLRMLVTVLALSQHKSITVINSAHTETAKGPHSAKRIVDAACESLGIPGPRLVKSKNEREDLYTVSNHITHRIGVVNEPDDRYVTEVSIAHDTFCMNFADAVALATENFNNELSTNGLDFSGIVTNPKGTSQVCLKERFPTGEVEDPRTACMRQDNGPRSQPEVFLEERTTCKADPVNALYPGKSTGWNKVEATYSFKHDTRVTLRRREVRQEPNESSAILGYRERGSFYNITKKTSVFYPMNSKKQKLVNMCKKIPFLGSNETGSHGIVKVFHEVPYGNAIGYIFVEQYEAIQRIGPKDAYGFQETVTERKNAETLSVIGYLFNEKNRKLMKDRKTQGLTNRFSVNIHNKLPGLEEITGYRAVKYCVTPEFYKYPRRISPGSISAAYDSYFHLPDVKYLESLKEELEVSRGMTYVLKLAYYEAVRLYCAILPTPQVLMVLPRYESVMHEKHKDCLGKPMKQKTVLRTHKKELLTRMKSLKEVPYISKDGRSVTFERPKNGGYNILEMIVHSEMYRNNQDEEYLIKSQLGSKVETTIPQHATGLERISACCYNALTLFSGLLVASGTVAIVKQLIRIGIGGIFGCPADYSENNIDGVANVATAINGCVRSWQGVAWTGLATFAGTTSAYVTTTAAVLGTPIACAVSATLGLCAKGVRMLVSKRARKLKDDGCNSRLKVLASGLQIASEETQPPLIRMGCAALEAYYGHVSTLALHTLNTAVSLTPYVLYGAGVVAMPGFFTTLGFCFLGQCGIHTLWNTLSCTEEPSILDKLIDSDDESDDDDEQPRLLDNGPFLA